VHSVFDVWISITRASGRGLAVKITSFLGPGKWQRADREGRLRGERKGHSRRIQGEGRWLVVVNTNCLKPVPFKSHPSLKKQKKIIIRNVCIEKNAIFLIMIKVARSCSVRSCEYPDKKNIFAAILLCKGRHSE
jgi:hypothetical protein